MPRQRPRDELQQREDETSAQKLHPNKNNRRNGSALQKLVGDIVTQQLVAPRKVEKGRGSGRSGGSRSISPSRGGPSDSSRIAARANRSLLLGGPSGGEETDQSEREQSRGLLQQQKHASDALRGSSQPRGNGVNGTRPFPIISDSNAVSVMRFLFHFLGGIPEN